MDKYHDYPLDKSLRYLWYLFDDMAFWAGKDAGFYRSSFNMFSFRLIRIRKEVFRKD